MIDISEAKMIMGDSFIGPDEISSTNEMKLKIPGIIPDILFSADDLKEKTNDYLLILGMDQFADGRDVTIRNLLDIFGKDPEISEPCFYNQDWYLNESFIDLKMPLGWYLIRKNVYDSSRSVQPEVLMKDYEFPSAVKCCYSFFVNWFVCKTVLWEHDFVWCNDTDHNGDRIYVGKYHDIDGVNKNGFSIHRHLSLRLCYGCID